jgi:hypothetical protein
MKFANLFGIKSVNEVFPASKVNKLPRSSYNDSPSVDQLLLWSDCCW